MKPLLVSILLICALHTNAQIGIKLSLFSPTGEFGAIMKKTISGEIMFIDEFEGEGTSCRLRGGISFAMLKPRLDTFPLISIMTSGSNTTIIPGYQVFHKFNMGYFFGGIDFRFLELGNFSFYSGVDFTGGGVNMKYDSYYEKETGEKYDGGELFMGGRFRLGVEYAISDDAAFFIEANRNYNFIVGTGFFSHNDFGSGFRYYFSN